MNPLGHYDLACKCGKLRGKMSLIVVKHKPIATFEMSGTFYPRKDLLWCAECKEPAMMQAAISKAEEVEG